VLRLIHQKGGRSPLLQRLLQRPPQSCRRSALALMERRVSRHALVLQQRFLHRLQRTQVVVAPVEGALFGSHRFHAHHREPPWFGLQDGQQFGDEVLLQTQAQCRFADTRRADDKEQPGTCRVADDLLHHMEGGVQKRVADDFLDVPRQSF
jgi:hypothetical protein